jgi:hypothetical protein
MQTLSKRAIASRANGAKSQGPTSLAGKRRSSANSLRHGLLAKSIVLTYESESVFQQFFDEHLQKLNPADGVEYAVVEEIVTAAWRLRRIWNIESTLFNKAIGRSTDPNAAGRHADAFSALAGSNQLQLLDRYESRLHRMYQRSLNTLMQLRKIPESQPHPEPNEPILKPSELREGMTMPNEPKPDDASAPTLDQEARAQEAPTQAIPPAAPDAPATAQNPKPNEPKPAAKQPESPINYDFEPLQPIKFPSRT